MTELVVGAWEAELEHLGDAEGRERFICGVGSVQAGIGLSARLQQGGVDRVVALFTAGASQNSGLKIGDLCRAGDVCWLEGDMLRKSAYLPGGVPRQSVSSAGVQVVSTPGITADDQRAQLMEKAFGPFVENLEAWGIALACQHFKVSCDIHLGITNVVGSQAHQQWQENHQQLSRDLALLLNGPSDQSI